MKGPSILCACADLEFIEFGNEKESFVFMGFSKSKREPAEVMRRI